MNVYIENKIFWNHIVYSFETLFRCIHEYKNYFYPAEKVFQLNTKKDSIYYGNNAPEDFQGIVMEEGKLFSEHYLTKKCIPDCPLKRYEDIPVLFPNKKKDAPAFFQKGEQKRINFDMVQGTFYLITGCEEIIGREEEFDIHGRYSIKNRILYKEGMLYRPIINMYAELLKKFMQSVGFCTNKKQYQSYAHISHDVDVPYNRNFPYFRKAFHKIFNRNLEYEIQKGFLFMDNIERKYGIHSSYYFMSGGNNPGYEDGYDFCDTKIQKMIDNILNQGNEIGWHYSYNAATDYIQMKREYAYFNKYRKGLPYSGRNHYLRYRIPESWRTYSELHLVYDATLASAEWEGFVYGICTPFQLFDAENGENLDVWEIPLLVMDGTVCTPQYRGLMPEEVIDTIKNLISEVKKYDGVFSILWHNSSLKNRQWEKWEDTYVNIMKILGTEFICTTGMDIIDIFANKKELKNKN